MADFDRDYFVRVFRAMAVAAEEHRDEWTKLVSGMTLTVEPGLYIRPGTDIPPALAGIGIRIEDDVRVTETGCDIFTSAPKTVAEIEEVMRHD